MMSNSDVEEPPENMETSPSFPLSSLPDELSLSCLARVSPSDYEALSLVSKRYRSLLVSPQLYKMRSLMGLTENCHYLYLRTGHDSTPSWHILRREKNKFRLIQISLNPGRRYGSSVVVLDWGIYVIGGYRISSKPTSDVFLLDCRTHTWHKLPSMAVGRAFAAAGVVGAKIYLFGGCKEIDSSKWGEVFDLKTQTWDTLIPMPDWDIRLHWIDASLVIDEKVYAVMTTDVDSISLYYSPSEGKWGTRNFDSKPYLNPVYVMIDKLFYLYDAFSEKLFWCEKDEFVWKEVKGLDSLLTSGISLSNMINFGEKIVVFWHVDVPEFYCKRTEIWCAEISLERHEEGYEIRGKVEWSDSLITLDHFLYNSPAVTYSLVYVNL